MEYFKATLLKSPIKICSSEYKNIDMFGNTKYNFEIIDLIDGFDKKLSISEKAYSKLKKLDYFNKEIYVFKEKIGAYEQISFEMLNEEDLSKVNLLSKSEKQNVKKEINIETELEKRMRELEQLDEDFQNGKEVGDNEIDRLLNEKKEIKINDEENKKIQKEFEIITFTEQQNELFKQIINEEKKVKNNETIDENGLKLLDILPFDLLPLQHRLNLA